MKGTFIFSPVNRILIDHYGVDSSFLIISGILLNLIACGLVIRPVPIEPAEKEKKLKKQKKLSKKIKLNKKEIETKISEENEKIPLEAIKTNQDTLLEGEKNDYENYHEKPIESIKNETNITDMPKKKKSVKETIKSFIDFSLFYDIIFMFFAASNFLTSLGFNAPYIFIVDQAISLGVEKHKADILLSTIGEAFRSFLIMFLISN